jgi:hypothetical protein
MIDTIEHLVLHFAHGDGHAETQSTTDDVGSRDGAGRLNGA